MAKTDEVVTVNISTETGKPISYRVEQRFFAIRFKSNIYIPLISQFRFIGTMARWPTRMTLKPIHFGSPTPTLMWVQTCYITTYLATFQPGKYNINVTAYNLHSNELYGYNKFINNMTRWGQWTIFLIFSFCVSRTLLIQKPVENWKLEVISSTKIISTKCQTFQTFIKVVSFNQMSRRHIDGLTRMEVTLPTSSIQTTLSFPQRLMWVNLLDGFPFFWWHMVFLKRCYIMFVFILPRKVTFNSLGNTGGMRLGWRVAALHWSTWQNDARNSELSLGGLHNAHCVSIWIYSYFLGGHRFEIHNWARLCVGWRIQYHVQVSIK